MRVIKTIAITKRQQRDSGGLELSVPGASARSKGIRSVSYKTPTRPGVGPGIDLCPLHIAGNFAEYRKAIRRCGALATSRPASSDRPV
jgi:hypothetical protein